MDHDNEVTTSLVQARNTFLSQRIDDDTHQEKYFLEQEFEKTRHNRAKIVPLVLFIVLVVSVLLTWGVSLLVSSSEKENVAVVDNFQELRLRDILDSAKKNENALRNQERDLAALVSEKEGAQEQARTETRAALALLSQRLISNAEKNRQRQVLLRNERTQLARIEQDYAARIEEKKAEIETIKLQLSEYQVRLSDQDRREQENLDNSQRVFQQQTSTLQNNYEERLRRLESQSRETLQGERNFHRDYVKLTEEKHAEEIRQLILLYNPIIERDEASRIIARPIELPESGRPGYSSVLTDEGLWTQKDYEKVYFDILDHKVLIERLSQVPYENSVPNTLSQILKLAQSNFSELDALWNRIALRLFDKNKKIQELNRELSELEGILASFGATIPENGFVIDPTNSERIKIWIRANIQPEEGAQGLVLRGETSVGSVEFFLENGKLFARTVSLVAPRNTIRAFDRIQIQNTQE